MPRPIFVLQRNIIRCIRAYKCYRKQKDCPRIPPPSQKRNHIDCFWDEPTFLKVFRSGHATTDLTTILFLNLVLSFLDPEISFTVNPTSFFEQETYSS